MSQYVTVRNVPILDEHDLTDDEGNTIVKVDESKLREIARNNNRRVTETGDETPIVLGHTDDEAQESDQPEVLGYARDFKVGQLFKSGRKCIKATFRVLKEKAHLLKKFPRRSVELWLRQWVIDPIAVLGASTPDRDLGLLRLSRINKSKLSYSRTLNMETCVGDNVNDIVGQVVAALKETKEWKMLESMSQGAEPSPVGDDSDIDMDLLGGEGGDPLQASKPPMGADVTPSPVGDDEDLDIDMGDEELAPEEDEVPPKKYGAGYATGTNTLTPTPVGKRKMSRQPVLSPVERRLIRAEQGLARQTEINKNFRVRLRKAERGRDLQELASVGYNIDIEDELNDVVDMTEGQYSRYLAKLKKNYSRVPVGETDVVKYSRSNSGGSGRSREEANEIVKLAEREGITYEQALRKHTGTKVG